MKLEMFCGGVAETNGYLLSHQGEAIVVDAPEGMTDWVEDRIAKNQLKIVALLLTHGHWDHIVDALSMQQKLKTSVVIHRDSAPLLEIPSIQDPFNSFYQLKPCKADRILDQDQILKLNGFEFQTLLCPGHCPGSICFYLSNEKLLFGGDVLFAGGVGRWDLPGASQKELFDSIQKKLLTLPDETQVLPGHGPTTTMGEERRNNPYLQSLVKTRSSNVL
jgi:hydroxyacylglutathione hydrolase